MAIYMCSSIILMHYAALLDMPLPFICSKNNSLSEVLIDETH